MTFRRSDAWRAITNLPLVVGSLGIAAIVALVLFGPELAPSDPQAQRVIIFYPDGSFAAPPTPPDRFYVLGTDPLGRDQLARLMWGARLTVTALLLGLAGRALLGVGLGLVAGWRRGGWLDRAIGHVTNAVAGVPQLMLALLVVIALRDEGVTGFIVALAAVGWAELAQFVRSGTARAVATPHVEAARALGGTVPHVARVHVLRDLLPQVTGLLALEAGSVLLLMAELGFIGFFISGGTFYTDDAGRPVLPIRDRAPEWGQMLAGARHYAFKDQYVAFVPGVVVVSAVLAFNLFAEGLRAATDPFGMRRLSPRTLGRIARVAFAGLLVGVVGLGYASATSTQLSFDDGARTAREAAARVLPGAPLVAGVLRFTSEAHAMSRPEKLNYYFRSADGTLLRVGFVDADANAMEVKLHSHEDNVVFEVLQPLDQWGVPWESALGDAEKARGITFRNANPRYLVRVVLAQDRDAAPVYRVQYTTPAARGSVLELRSLARAHPTRADLRPEELPADAASRARQLLGGSVRLESMSATWVSERGALPPFLGELPRLGAVRPAQVGMSFVRPEFGAQAQNASITYALDRVGAPTAGVLGTGIRPGEHREISYAELLSAFERVDAIELRGSRERAEALGRAWWISISLAARQGALIDVQFSDGASTANFRYDPQTGTLQRR